ncbi:MAG: DegT/DnrJ/EryC1/StrS family aminotransferase, partial [Chloroflexota bacterium]
EIMQKLTERIRVVPILDAQDRIVDLIWFDQRMNIPVAEPSIGLSELHYVTECIVTGWVSSTGRFVDQFEELFASFCGAEYAIATSNGTTALHLTLLVAGIGAGDEVLVPSFTFISTANAVLYTGATPIFVDIDPKTWTIATQEIEQAITPRTRAIIPVHVYGHPADMDPIMEIAARHNLIVIEDAAEAHGAEYKSRRVGAIGELGMFSFYGNKIITTGEGGMIVTNNSEYADTLRLLRGHGMSRTRRYWHEILGYNYRMTNLQAAVGVGQMEKIDRLIVRKREIARRYTDQLQGIPGLTLPSEMVWAKSVYWLYTVVIDAATFGITRDTLMEELSAKGIDTR